MKPRDAVVLLLFLDQAKPAFAGRGVKEQDANVQPFVANQIRRVTEHAVSAVSFSWRFSGTPGCGRVFIHDSHPIPNPLPIPSFAPHHHLPPPPPPPHTPLD